MSIYQTTERLQRYQTLAAEANAAGFTSEAKRKEALDLLNRAYEIARDQLHSVLRVEFPWNEAERRYPEAYLTLSDVAPYGLHQWRPKHAQQLAGYPDFVTLVTRLAALRETIKAAALVAKQPRPKTAAQLAKEATQMTCQICGRGIFAEGGVIAHHGYERPGWGYQTASCEGARALPFEVSKVALGDHLLDVAAEIDRLTQKIAKVLVETAPVPISWAHKDYDKVLRRHPQHTTWVTRADFDAKLAEIVAQARSHPYIFDFDKAKALHLENLRGQLDQAERYREEQAQRFDAWTQTHRAGAAGETTWVAL